jgi:hypothetical protein
MTVLKRILVLTIALLVAFQLAACGIAAPTTEPAQAPSLVQQLSTPELIDQALARGEITEEERLLYLAYAVYEYESLPARFRGNVGWRATSVVAEIYEVVGSPSMLCSMSPHVRREFQRLFNQETTCE